MVTDSNSEIDLADGRSAVAKSPGDDCGINCKPIFQFLIVGFLTFLRSFSLHGMVSMSRMKRRGSDGATKVAGSSFDLHCYPFLSSNV
jgi:hypothetical protein